MVVAVVAIADRPRDPAGRRIDLHHRDRRGSARRRDDHRGDDGGDHEQGSNRRQPPPPSTSTFVRRDGRARVRGFLGIHRPGDRSLVDVLKREKGPRAGDATQLVDAGVPEAERRPDDQVFHRAGDEDLARSRERHHAGARVDPDPADVPVDRLDLARVHTRADLDPE